MSFTKEDTREIMIVKENIAYPKDVVFKDRVLEEVEKLKKDLFEAVKLIISNKTERDGMKADVEALTFNLVRDIK